MGALCFAGAFETAQACLPCCGFIGDYMIAGGAVGGGMAAMGEAQTAYRQNRGRKDDQAMEVQPGPGRPPPVPPSRDYDDQASA